MVNVDARRAIFRGADTVCTGWIKKDNDIVYFKKPRKWFPFLGRWIPLYGNVDVEMKNYVECTLFDVEDGRTDEKVLFFNFDIDTLKAYAPIGNNELLNEVKSLRTENDFLRRSILDVEETLKTSGSMDLLQKKMADLYDFVTNKLRPPYMGGKKDDKKK